MLKALGQTAFKAAAVISVGSWVMILSDTVCGQIADRTSKRNLVLTVCMSGAAVALVLLTVDGAGMGASILFGLVGMAPAGVIMALAGEAMRRGHGRLLHGPLYDHDGDPGYYRLDVRRDRFGEISDLFRSLSVRSCRANSPPLQVHKRA
jgi:hypothetical protein